TTAAGVLALLAAAPVSAKVFHSQEEALALAFPDADRIESDTTLLSEAQVAAVEAAARSKLETRIAKFYVGWKDGERLGYAFIDVHTVRTLPEAFLVVLTPEGRVRTLRVLAFHEPLDYMPTKHWYEQFDGKGLEDPLRLGGDVHGVVGATLSSRAVTQSVRRVLALHRYVVRGDRPDAPASDAAEGPGAGDD
ncbi:MAG: FMN-binding protein, partial [Myxococcales bacterium]|nr:FMN-binding protein [Myxococcales bacterium]